MLTFLIILAVLIILYVAVCFIFSRLILYPVRQPIFELPSDYGMDYEDISFKTSDGLNIAGWYIKGSSDSLLIFTHPFSFNCAGLLATAQGLIWMTKKDIHFLKTAKTLNDEGYSIIMFDFRNHGKSDRSPKGTITLGLTEYKDIEGAVNYIKSQESLRSKKLGIVSHCMGADTAIIASTLAKDALKDLKCIVAVQPISMRVFLTCYLHSSYTQLSLILMPLLNIFIKLRGGYYIDDMSPKAYITEIAVPTMYVQSIDDPWTNLKEIEKFNVHTNKSEMFMIDGLSERYDTYNYFGDHKEKLVEFLNRYMEPSSDH